MIVGTKMYKKLVRAINYLESIGELEQTEAIIALTPRLLKPVVGDLSSYLFGFVTYAEGEPDCLEAEL